MIPYILKDEGTVEFFKAKIHKSHNLKQTDSHKLKGKLKGTKALKQVRA